MALNGTEYYLGYLLFNPVSSTIPKWRMFKYLRWVLLLNWLVDLNEILHGSDGIEYYFDNVLFNTVASTIPKWRTFKLLRCVQLLNRLVDLDEILCGDDDIESDLSQLELIP
jgi:hypothetical protein